MSAAAKSPLRILEIETFGRGGLIHYAYNLSLALAERGHEVILVTTAAYELADRWDLPANVRLVKTIARGTTRVHESLPGFALSLALKVEAIFDGFVVAALARRLRPDVIHLHCTNQISVLYVSLLRRLGRPVVVTAHIVTPHERIPFQDRIYRRIYGQSHLVVAHSEVDRKRLLEEFAVDTERVTVIPHGEYSFFERGAKRPGREAARQSLGIGLQEEVALFFGYIREYKGLDLLLEAWPAVTEERPRARLVVAGDPVRLNLARRREFESWAMRLGAVHRFGYIPFSDVTRYFDAADVLVMPYRHISQSGVLFLALSLGVPVVAARVGAFPEMLRHGESALLVPPESISDLAQALVRVLGDSELRTRLVRGGQRVAEQHSWQSIAERTERAFARLVEG